MPEREAVSLCSSPKPRQPCFDFLCFVPKEFRIAAVPTVRFLIESPKVDSGAIVFSFSRFLHFSDVDDADELLSRAKARETLDMEAYKKIMKGIYTTSVNEATIDEAPMAYKSLEDIIDVMKIAKMNGCKMLLISEQIHSSMSKLSDYTMNVSVSKDEGYDIDSRLHMHLAIVFLLRELVNQHLYSKKYL